MTTVSPTIPSQAHTGSLAGEAASLRWAISDTLTIAKRNLLAYTRIPEAMFFALVQPIMFVVLFRYVFGGVLGTSLARAHIHYADYLLPGVFSQTLAFGAVSTSVGLAEDLQKGLIERFRALPMSRFAVLAGRTVADLVRNFVVVILVTGIGFAVGFRMRAGVGEYLLGIALVLLFSFALSWGFAVLGLSASNSETAQVMAFPLLFPLTFASSAFVPVATMPSWLQGFATYQPVSVITNASRDLMTGPKAALLNHVSTSTQFWEAFAWAVGLLVVFIPLAVWRFKTRALG